MAGGKAVTRRRWWNLRQQRARYPVLNFSKNIYHLNLALDIGYLGTIIDNIRSKEGEIPHSAPWEAFTLRQSCVRNVTAVQWSQSNVD